MHLKSHLRCQALMFKCMGSYIHTPFIHTHPINPLRLKQIGHEFAAISKWIFLNENLCILIRISLKFVLKGPIDNKPALLQTMVWRWTGSKPCTNDGLVHWCIYVTLPHWITCIDNYNAINLFCPDVINVLTLKQWGPLLFTWFYLDLGIYK